MSFDAWKSLVGADCVSLRGGYASEQHTLQKVPLFLVAATCVVVGVLHPLATDATKDARCSSSTCLEPQTSVTCCGP
eukprot:2208614-Amphidinium_carterae.1